VPICVGAMLPLLALYLPAAVDLLRRVPRRTDAPLRDLVAAIGPRLLEVDNPDAFFNVNAPEDLLHAAALLDRSADR
jgi:molybdopterin-guanine dinucleotide biosynthesis protein A